MIPPGTAQVSGRKAKHVLWHCAQKKSGHRVGPIGVKLCRPTMGRQARIVTGTVVALLAGLVFWETERWFTTRIFEPVSVPPSLVSERFETQFAINLPQDYDVLIKLDYSVDDWFENDSTKCKAQRLDKLSWRVLLLPAVDGDSKMPWATVEEADGYSVYLGHFRGLAGRYRLELKIPQTAACLNARHPHLIVRTDRQPYLDRCGRIELVCLLLGLTGILFAAGGIRRGLWMDAPSQETPRIFPEIALRNVIRRTRHRQLETIANLNNLTVMWTAVLCAMIVIFYWLLIRPYPLYGLAVEFRSPRGVAVQAPSPWQKTMSVYIDGQDRFYVNGEHVERARLEERLREELSKRVEWSVYVEADAGSSFRETLHAMDEIEGLGGKVIWITPKTRREWAESKERSLTRVYYPAGAHGWRKADPTQ